MYEGRTSLVIVDRHPDRLALADHFGAITINDAKEDPADRGCACVGFHAHDPQGHEVSNAVMNKLVKSVKATGSLGVVGVFMPEDPESQDELARKGQVVFDFGAFWTKGLQRRRRATQPGHPTECFRVRGTGGHSRGDEQPGRAATANDVVLPARTPHRCKRGLAVQKDVRQATIAGPTPLRDAYLSPDRGLPRLSHNGIHSLLRKSVAHAGLAVTCMACASNRARISACLPRGIL